MYKFFCTLDQTDTQETKVLKDNHYQIFKKEIKHVQQGLLSDPPGIGVKDMSSVHVTFQMVL